MNPSNYVRFFARVELVHGVNKSLIYDLQRGSTYEVPTLLFDVLIAFRELSIGAVKEKFKHEYDEGIDLYLEKLVDLELVFITAEPEAFPIINYDNWDYPLKLTNAILEFPEKQAYSFMDIIQQLDQLGCAQIQIRVLEKENFKLSYFLKLLKKTERSRIKIIELILPYSMFSSEEEIRELYKANLRLTTIVFHSFPTAKTEKIKNEWLRDRVFLQEKSLTENQPDFVSENTMVYNSVFYGEAQEHNTALNRKICIDSNGNFKNYLSHETVFGSAKHIKIEDLIKSAAFKTKWFIANTKIEKCRDCQYKFACFFNSDIEERKGKFYKTADCGFDPYENQWGSLNLIKRSA